MNDKMIQVPILQSIRDPKVVNQVYQPTLTLSKNSSRWSSSMWGLVVGTKLWIIFFCSLMDYFGGCKFIDQTLPQCRVSFIPNRFGNILSYLLLHFSISFSKFLYVEVSQPSNSIFPLTNHLNHPWIIIFLLWRSRCHIGPWGSIQISHSSTVTTMIPSGCQIGLPCFNGSIISGLDQLFVCVLT